MANPPPNFGQELHVNATRPLSAYVNGRRIRLEAKPEDGSELFLWLTKDQFQGSLGILQIGAHKLGVPWPPALKL
jgi:hypothetical protein